MDQIRIDPTNVFASAVGDERGLERAALDAWCADAARRLGSVLDARPADERAERVDPWLDYVASTPGRFRAVVVLAAAEEARLVRAVATALVSPYADLAAAAALPRLVVLDETDPDVVGEFLDAFDTSECLFVVAARDGDAPEVVAPFRIVRAILSERLGAEGHTDHVVFAGRPTHGELREHAAQGAYAVLADEAVARDDALTPHVMLAAALVGVDVKGLAFGAAAMAEACASPAWESNPALLLAGVDALLARRGQRASACAFGRRLRDLAEWTAPGAPLRSGVAARLAEPDGAWLALLAADRADHSLALASGGSSARVPGGTLNDVFARERDVLRTHLARHGRPNATIHLPSVTAHSVGQYLELVRIARALGVEDRGRPTGANRGA